jgi:prepilin-type N-terminal cleavage/methylation domain-containing protein
MDMSHNRSQVAGFTLIECLAALLVSGWVLYILFNGVIHLVQHIHRYDQKTLVQRQVDEWLKLCREDLQHRVGYRSGEWPVVISESSMNSKITWVRATPSTDFDQWAEYKRVTYEYDALGCELIRILQGGSSSESPLIQRRTAPIKVAFFEIVPCSLSGVSLKSGAEWTSNPDALPAYWRIHIQALTGIQIDQLTNNVDSADLGQLDSVDSSLTVDCPVNDF